MFIGLAESGKGGITRSASYGKPLYGSGGGGGAGGIVVSVFALYKGDTVSLQINRSVSISAQDSTATATPGGNGEDGRVVPPAGFEGYGVGGSGGSGGNATGGNYTNQPGSTGGRGYGTENSPTYGQGASNTYRGYSTSGGNGSGAAGTTAYIIVMRGNTNLTHSNMNSQDITALMLDVDQLFQEQTSILMQQN